MTTHISCCEGCDRCLSDCLKANRCSINPDRLICEECGFTVDLEELPDDQVEMSTEHEEFWGAPCSYRIPIGYVCPGCGHYNAF